jgi:hypothetical protein
MICCRDDQGEEFEEEVVAGNMDLAWEMSCEINWPNDYEVLNIEEIEP